ncbi:HD domain-containing protein [Geoalkalibacter halelectricus]|uniref:HD domain-containing protein n=1 Tax=Geoalkalibacter halelectricus TaxID=2847045 RepID=UPI00266EBCCE|nr:HD domain-containing protein [Geoalkalibacter halelectricus]MDO3380524.1 HD domain-containing protein [Geoalkalibacter halelectricus]
MPSTARAFAIAAHGSQRYGEHPYAVHLDAVAELLAPFGKDAVRVGYLHDVVEDTEIALDQVRAEFGDVVAHCVALLTDESGEDRKERKAKTYAKLARVGPELALALTVKAADRLANVRACIADGKVELLAVYRSEHPTFRGAAYRPGRCDRLWRELDLLLAAKREP